MSNPYAPPPPGGRPRPDGPSTTAPQRPAPAEAPADRTPPDGSAPPAGQTPPDPAPAPLPSPPRPPAPTAPPPDPEAIRESSRQVMHFGLAMLACLVTSTLPLPWQAGGLAFALLALVMGVRALRSVRASGVRGVLVPALSIGLAFAAVLALSMVTSLAMWPLQMDRQDCLRDALTISAQQTCEEQFREATTNLSIFSGR